MPNANGIHWIRDDKRFAIYLRDGFKCIYCAKSLRNLELDHCVPRAHGGTNHESNLVTCCRGCNTTKGERNSADWLQAREDNGESLSKLVPIYKRLLKAIGMPINRKKGKKLWCLAKGKSC